MPYIYFFALFFYLLLHRLAVRIRLPFYDFPQVIIVLLQAYSGTTQPFVAVGLLIFYIFVLSNPHHHHHHHRHHRHHHDHDHHHHHCRHHRYYYLSHGILLSGQSNKSQQGRLFCSSQVINVQPMIPRSLSEPLN